VRQVVGCIPVTIDHELLRVNLSFPGASVHRSLRLKVPHPRLLAVSASKATDWILPKGGWERFESATECAFRETLEEAGVFGPLLAPGYYALPVANDDDDVTLPPPPTLPASPSPLCALSYSSPRQVPHAAYLYLQLVSHALAEYPERDRGRAWLTVEEAAACVHRVHMLGAVRAAAGALEGWLVAEGVGLALRWLEAEAGAEAAAAVDADVDVDNAAQDAGDADTAPLHVWEWLATAPACPQEAALRRVVLGFARQLTAARLEALSEAQRALAVRKFGCLDCEEMRVDAADMEEVTRASGGVTARPAEVRYGSTLVVDSRRA
jgi:8-oxo-dGTP pyrophosphatase MutT (NUDIX family)